jgi:phospholipase C
MLRLRSQAAASRGLDRREEGVIMNGRTLRGSRRQLLGQAVAGLSALALTPIVPIRSANGQAATPIGNRPIDQIQHLIVIYQENWSFDSLYGRFPGADGLANAGATIRQVDKQGVPYTTLPQPIDTTRKPPIPDPRFPADLPVAPFDAARYVPATMKTGDAVHRFYQEQFQIDGGKMDKFVAWSDAAGLAMSYYDATTLPEGLLAQQYTLADQCFHSAFGGSFLNHQWLIAAATPRWPNAPTDKIARLAADGTLVKDGVVTPDGFVVNTAFPRTGPHPATMTDPTQLVPLQTHPTIGDRLDAAGVSWAWYAGGWNDAVAGTPDPLFQFHHQAFAYYQNYALGTPGQRRHLKDETDFRAALASGDVPSVSFIKPIGEDNEHPGYALLTAGQRHVTDLVHAIQASPIWPHAAIIVTYDENGGRWDHVAPPVIDRWGSGTRVPMLIISPFAKKGVVDHTPYETVSILKFVETRWNVPPLGDRDANANDLTNAFDFSGPSEPATPAAIPMASPVA